MPDFNPKKLFVLSGSNMNFVDSVLFGEEEVEELFYISTTGISGKVPAAAATDNLFVSVGNGMLDLGSQYVVLDSDSQLIVSGISSEFVSGKAGDLIQISGENFYQVTDVNFGGTMGNQLAEFEVLSDNIIQAVVPTGANYSEVSVFSSIRTGTLGNTSLASGKSSNKFVPIPAVTGINSGQMLGGKDLVIGGQNLSGVTGISINDINFTNFTSLAGTGVKATVPTGLQVGDTYTNTRGRINLLLESGISHLVQEDFSFEPFTQVVGITPGVQVGGTMTISGYNFNSGVFHTGEFAGSLGTGCLVSVGGQTGNFKIIGDAGGYNRIQGNVPTGINLSVSGGNVAIGVEITTQSVDLFSDDYPQTYVNEVRFRPGIGSPTFTSLSPKSGIGGDSIIIKGGNLYGITGLNYRGGNVGVGTEFKEVQIVEVTPGESLMSVIPDTSNFSSAGGFLDLDISGHFGNVGVQSAFFVYGTPVITNISPGGSGILPGSTGTIYGERLYSGTEVQLYGGNGTLAPANFQQKLNVSGYSTDHTEIVFNYPNVFETGNTYGIRAVNQRAGTSLHRFTGFNNPVLSGVSRVSGVQGERVILSGTFEKIKPSGLTLGQKVITDFEQVPTAGNPHQFTGIVFDIPKNTQSNLINIDTSGGFVASTGILNVTPAAPEISGFYKSVTGQVPYYYNSDDQIFGGTDTITITGERLNLATGIRFTGLNSEIHLNVFESQNPNTMSFILPTGVNPDSGDFILQDFISREVNSPFPLNISLLSGYDGAVVPHGIMNFSGQNVTGLDIVFKNPTGGLIKPETTTNAISGGVDVLSIKLPTGISNQNILITGRHNDSIVEVFAYNPLPVITGVTGQNSSNQISTGQLIGITGVNFGSSLASSGSFGAVGISGTQGLYASTRIDTNFGIENNLTGSGALGDPINYNTFFNKLEVRVPNDFIGTGKLFITDMVDGLEKQVNFFSEDFIITGERVNVTGYGPSRGVTGSQIEFTGFGLNNVDAVYLSTVSGQIDTDLGSPSYNTAPDNINNGVIPAEFTRNSNNKITVTVPEEAIEFRGKTNILFTGGTNYTVSGFEIILDASVVEYNIVEENDTPTSSVNVGNFTQKETINGVVFLVTRTRFPDGTTAVISSTPYET